MRRLPKAELVRRVREAIRLHDRDQRRIDAVSRLVWGRPIGAPVALLRLWLAEHGEARP